MMLDVLVDCDGEWDSSTDWDKEVARAAAAAIAESAFLQLAASPRTLEISVRLTGDDEVRALNEQWRAKNTPTNVLSFPMVDSNNLAQATVAGPELLLGDIILARGVCEAEAVDKGLTIADHAMHLIVHGTLHLLGYDHHDEDHAADMEQREVRALARLGIANPYEEAA